MRGYEMRCGQVLSDATQTQHLESYYSPVSTELF